MPAKLNAPHQFLSPRPHLYRRSLIIVAGIILSFVGYRQVDRQVALYQSPSYHPQDVATKNIDSDSTTTETADESEQTINDELLPQQETIDVAESNTDIGPRKPKIVHITPLYKVTNCDSRFCPYDQDQSIMVASMIRARDESKNADVTLVTTVFPEDAEAVPTEFIRLRDLPRSTSTEYPQFNTTKTLPFANDIFDSLRDWQDLTSFDYVVYTNADIIVRNNFYDKVATQIQEGYDGFIINRQTVRSQPNFTASDLDAIYNHKGKPHPGKDCFVIKLDIFRQMDMGDVFIGYKPLGNIIYIQMEFYADKFRIFKSQTLRATYHLGEDRAWQRKGGPHRSFALQNMKNAFHLEFWQKMCKFKVDTNAESPQTKNVIYQGSSKICTGIAYNFWCEGLDPCEVATCEYVARGSLTTKGKCKNTLLTMRKKKSN